MTDKKYRKAVSAIILNPANKFLVAQLQAYGEGQWTFVGGGVDEGESYLEAMKREVTEEIGLTEEDYEIIGKSIHIHTYKFSENISDNPIFTKFIGQKRVQFVIKLHEDKPLKIQDEEIRDHKWVTAEELPSYLIFDGQYSNALQVIEEFRI